VPRIRTIKPDACTSKTLTKCSRDARLFFHLLSTHLDDKGRIECLYKKLAGEIFPHDEDVTAADIRRWIEELEAADFALRRYEVDGDEYLCAPKFNEHQVINKPTPSRLPSPPWQVLEPLPEPSNETTEPTTVVTAGEVTDPLREPSGSDPMATTGIGNRKEEDGKGKEEPAKAGGGDGGATTDKRESNAAMLLRLLPESHQTQEVREAIAAYFRVRIAKKWGRLADEVIESRAKEFAKFQPEAIAWAYSESARHQWQSVKPENWKPPDRRGRASPSTKTAGDYLKDRVTN